MASTKQNPSPYLTWGCADDLTCRLKKTLYCSDDDDCYKSSSAALTDVVVSMFTAAAPCPRRKLKHQYASSLVRQLSLTPCALMLGILYSERLRQSGPSYRERVSSSDLYVAALLVASKFLHDEGEEEEIFNEEWAEAAGLSVKTVNRLEREFLDAMDWNIYVTPLEFLDICARVETKIALQYGLRRGWFSYTDLTQFLLASNYPNLLTGIAESVVKIIGGCALLYGMSLSLLTSSMLCIVSASSNTNTMKSSTVPQSSCNHTSMSSCQQVYSDRYLTRRRTVQRKDISQNHLNSTENIFVNTDEELKNRLESNQTLAMLDPTKNSQPRINNADIHRKNSDRRLANNADPCYCKRNQHVCFESHFRHLSHQTRLGIPLDPGKWNQFCVETTFTDTSSSCPCSNPPSNGKFSNVLVNGKLSTTLTKFTKNHHLEVSMSRKVHSRNFMLNPSVLGMVVM